MVRIIQETIAIIQIAEKRLKTIHGNLREIVLGVEKVKQFKSNIQPINYISMAHTSIEVFKGKTIRIDLDRVNVQGHVTDVDRRLQDSETKNKLNGLKNSYIKAKDEFFKEAAEKIAVVDNNFNKMTVEAGRADRKNKGIPGTPEPKLDLIDTESALALNTLDEVEAKLSDLKNKLEAIKDFLISLE